MTEDMTKTFAVDGPIDLVVRVGAGSVTVETQDGLSEASVTLDPGKHAAELLDQTAVEMRGSALAIHGPRQGGIFDLPLFGGRHSSHGLAIRVLVPTHSRVKVGTFTAPIWIPGTVASADLSFGYGEAAVHEVTGELRLRFGSGTAKAVRVGGSAQVRSGNGDALFGEIDGELRSGTGTGSLRVGVARGRVQARSGSGAAELGEVHSDVDLVTGSGALDIGLAPGVTARLDLHSGSGAVRSDLPVENEPRRAEGAITVRARTGSGNVRLFRAEAQPVAADR